MRITITQGVTDNLSWLAENDNHVSSQWVERCIQNKEYFVAKAGNECVGFLRFSWFWGSVPYMDMIKVTESSRRIGIGTALFDHWQDAMKKNGAKVLMTSAMADEPEPQAWHCRNGFAPSGRLTFGKLQETPEIFFVKDLAGR